MDDNRRNYNRQRFELFSMSIGFYIFTFGMLYLSILLPLLAKTLFNTTGFNLNTIKIFGSFMPDLIITYSSFKAAFLYILIPAIILYIPLLILNNFISIPVIAILDNFYKITTKRLIRIKMPTFLLIVYPVFSFSIYVFLEKNIKDSFLISLFLIIFAILWILLGNEEKK